MKLAEDTKPEIRKVSAMKSGTPVTNGLPASAMTHRQVVKHSDSSRALPGEGVEAEGQPTIDSNLRPDTDQYNQKQEVQASFDNNTDKSADDLAAKMPPAPSRQRSAFSVAKKRPPGSDNSDDDDDDDGKDVDINTEVNRGDDRNNNNSSENTSKGASSWEADMGDSGIANGTSMKKRDGRPDENRKQYEENSDSRSEGPSREESIDIPMAYDTPENGNSRRANNRINSQQKSSNSNPATPRDEFASKIPRSISNDNAFSPNNNLSPMSDMDKKRHPLASLPGSGVGRSPDEDAKSSFSGKSTLPRSNTLSSGLTLEGDDEDSVNVVVRVRPLSQLEKDRNDKSTIQFPGDGAVWVDTGMVNKAFTFNVMFEPEAAQQDVFDHSGMKKLVEMAINGYSCTAFAFGQTGSGKTHTITGPPELYSNPQFGDLEGRDPDNYGLLPRSFHYLFHLMRQKPGTGYRISASYLEIYNEQVVDLLNPNQRKTFAVRWSKNRGFYVENLFMVECESIDDLMAVLEEGLRNRATGANSVNEHSSRSHSMLTLNIDSELQDPDDENLYITKHGKLTFVDLAGSEKTKTDSVTSPEHLVESNNINRSLLVLGNCISALGDSKKRNGHIPYRDSKLTKLLADSLGGSGVTLMIACVSPSAYNSAETMNTLRYANRAKKIKTKPIIKMDPRERLIVSLKREVKVLRQENHYLRQQLDFPVKPRGQLQKENDQKFLQMLKEYKKEGKINDHGLYEMLQEYMIENETLRTENTDLHSLRDQGRRDQQTLARENERLLRKLELLEKERMLVNTPISIYSVGSTISRRSSGVESQHDGGQYQGSPPSWQQASGPPPNQYNHYNKETPRKKKTPPSHLQHPQRPPHRLTEPVNKNNPGYLDSPRNNGYAGRYSNQQDYYHDNMQSDPPGAPVPHQGASYPQPKPSNNKPQNTRSTGYSKGAQKGLHSQETPPAPQPRQGVPANQNSQAYKAQQPMAENNSDYMNDDDVGESAESMNDRLRQELLDLEGQIKKQTRMSNRQPQSPPRTHKQTAPTHSNTRR